MDTEQNGSESAARNEELDTRNEAEVVLNVYDLLPALNCCGYWFGFGIYHSGIEVHGKEYGFGAHDFSVSGVYEVQPKRHLHFVYRCSIPLGYTDMQPSEVRTFIQTMASKYHGNTYHVLDKNCNHFTDDMARRLTGKQIPGWINRMARVCKLCNCLLPESLLQDTPIEHEYRPCLAYIPEAQPESRPTVDRHARNGSNIAYEDSDDGDEIREVHE